METIELLFTARLANVLVVAGIIFLLVAVLGTVAGKINPGKEGRIASGVIGVVLLVVGLSMHLVFDEIDDGNGGVNGAPMTQEEARQRAEEEARQRTEEEARQRAEEEARQRAEEEARQRAEEEARQRAEEEARQRGEEEARHRAEEEERQRAEEEERQRIEAVCGPIRVTRNATCRDFYAERSRWDIEKTRKCGLYQVSRYKEALNIRSQPEWEAFLSRCR